MYSFWLAQIRALCGEIDKAETILRRADAIAGPLGLLAEALDAQNNCFLRNMPLLFTQVEYAKAAIAPKLSDRYVGGGLAWGVRPSAQEPHLYRRGYRVEVHGGGTDDGSHAMSVSAFGRAPRPRGRAPRARAN
jgi:hypothetical protein